MWYRSEGKCFPTQGIVAIFCVLRHYTLTHFNFTCSRKSVSSFFILNHYITEKATTTASTATIKTSVYLHSPALYFHTGVPSASIRLLIDDIQSLSTHLIPVHYLRLYLHVTWIIGDDTDMLPSQFSGVEFKILILVTEPSMPQPNQSKRRRSPSPRDGPQTSRSTA